MSNALAHSAALVASAVASAALAVAATHLLVLAGGSRPPRSGRASRIRPPLLRCSLLQLVGGGAVCSLCAAAVASVCLVVPSFLQVFGLTTLRAALISAARNLDPSLAAITCAGTCVALAKSRALLAARAKPASPGLVLRFAVDLIATLAIVLALHALYALATFMQASDGGVAFLPGDGLLHLGTYLRAATPRLIGERSVRAAVLWLPMGASGSLWACAAISARVCRGRGVWPIASVAAMAAALWATLFTPI